MLKEQTSSRLIFLLLLVLISCSEKPAQPNRKKIASRRITFEDVAPESPLEWDSIAETLELVPLELTNESKVSNFKKVRIHNDIIYGLDTDQKTLFLFDITGKYLAKVRQGPGPNEVRELNDFTFDEKGDLWILSYESIVQLSGEGIVKEVFRLDFDLPYINHLNPIYISFANNFFYIWGGTVGHKNLVNKPTYTLYKINSDSKKIVDRFFETDRGLLEFYPRMIENGKDKFYMTTFITSDTIYRVTADGVSGEFAIDFGGQGLSSTTEATDPSMGESQALYTLGSTTNLCGELMNSIVTDRHVYFSYVCGDQNYQAIFDTKSLNVKTGKFYNPEKSFFPLVPTSVYNDKLVGYSDSYYLKPRIDRYKQRNEQPPLLAKYWDHLSAVSENDNPTIFLLTLKHF